MRCRPCFLFFSVSHLVYKSKRRYGLYVRNEQVPRVRTFSVANFSVVHRSRRSLEHRFLVLRGLKRRPVARGKSKLGSTAGAGFCLVLALQSTRCLKLENPF